MKIYELIPYETWMLWMVKKNLHQAFKDYNIKLFKKPIKENYKDEREFIICDYLWNLHLMPLGNRLESIEANMERSKNCQE